MAGIPSNPPNTSADPEFTPGNSVPRSRRARQVLYAAERHSPMHAALGVLLGLNGLRVSEACATNIEDRRSERGHRTLQIVGKGNKPAVIPLVPRTARTIDLAVGERLIRQLHDLGHGVALTKVE